MSKPVTILTERLSLGAILATDIPSIIKYAGDVKVAEQLLNLPHPYYEKDAIFWLNLAHQGWQDQSKYIFGIRLQATQELVGGIGLHVESSYDRAELGYWIGVPFWGQGYMSEAIATILKFGFREAGLNKIFAIHYMDNPASGKVMIKNGMIKEGELKEHIKVKGAYKNIAQYGLTKTTYEAMNLS